MEKRRNTPRWIGNQWLDKLTIRIGFLSDEAIIVNKEKQDFYKGQIINHYHYKKNIKEASVRIVGVIQMLCADGNRNGELFQKGWAYLCYFENIPVEDNNGKIISFISGYTIVDNPKLFLRRWAGGYLDQEDANLLDKNPEKAITTKIKGLEEIWNSSLRTLCQTCPAKGEQCKKRLEPLKPLNKNSFSFFSFFEPASLQRPDPCEVNRGPTSVS